VLLADDDARVLELLQLAFTQERFRVVAAVDGDEAIRRALAERPDLVVLDVRMPRRNGFEVCDYLRHDPEDPGVPIVLLSASGDTEVRIEGLSRGADDFLSKPFSPKELVARARRLLARSAETRAHARRTEQLERELGRARDEARRTGRDLAREQRLRELAYGLGRDLQGTLDLECLAARTLGAAIRQLGCASVAWLAPDEDADEFESRLVRQSGLSDDPRRFAHLALEASGELAALLAGLGRPVLVHELERRPGLRAELAPYMAAGVALLAPLRTGGTLEAVIVADERTDGASWSPDDRESLGALADFAATAHGNARRFRRAQDRELELAAGRAMASLPRLRKAADESWRVAAATVGMLRLPGRSRALLRHAVAFGAWAWGAEGRARLEELERLDPTNRVNALRALIRRGETLEVESCTPPAEAQAAILAGLCARYQVGRSSGRSAFESWETALAWVGSTADPALAEAVRQAAALPARAAPRGRAA
jgi:DNA-binding response OmpR family regulator